MEKTYFAVALLFLGLCLGSFVNAAAWRIRNKKDLLLDRSECTKCHYKLEWYDLIPVISWLWLKGRCRKCKKPVSAQYPLVELGVAAFFVASLAFWPNGFNDTTSLLQFCVWLISGVLLAILFVYDYRWMLLPDRIVVPLIGLGIAASILTAMEAKDITTFLVDFVGSITVLSGFYLALYVYSKGKWIGFGDVKLGLALGLLLCDWQLALVALFMANLIGTLVFVPGILTKRIKRTSHIPFGPFLILGFLVAGLFGHSIIDWYVALTYAGIAVPQYNY